MRAACCRKKRERINTESTEIGAQRTRRRIRGVQGRRLKKRFIGVGTRNGADISLLEMTETQMTIRRLKIVCFGAFAAIVLTSCNQLKSKDNSKETDALNNKMKRVQAEMVRQAEEPADKAAIESGTVFVHFKDLEDLGMPIIGVAVPNRLTGKRILVSFTREHFDQSAVDVLAREGLVDYKRALASSN